jgi:hypothetical protein
MWIRKSPTEVRLEKRAKLLYATCWDVLLGVGLWYVLVRLSVIFGLVESSKAVSGCIAGAVAAVLLPAAWYSSRPARDKRASTMVCDRCNALKTADDQPNCNCGGYYVVLPKMKWVNTTSFGNTSTGTESHILTRHMSWKAPRILT